MASGEQEEVEQVLVTLAPDPEKALEGWTTSPYEEAHHRGHYYVLRTLEEFMGKEPEVPQSDLILSVMQVGWSCRVQLHEFAHFISVGFQDILIT